MIKLKKAVKIVLSSVKSKNRWQKLPHIHEINQKNPQILRYPELAAYKVYSQNGEDGILYEIMSHIGFTNKFVVEFGVEDGRETNTRYLIEKYDLNYRYFDFDARNKPMEVISEKITMRNVNKIFAKHDVPKELDILSIDIDGYDYWVFSEALKNYKPRVIICEYNAFLGPTVKQTINFDPSYMWDGSQYFGASLNAFVSLFKKHNYRFICCDPKGVNAFFVRNDCAEPLLKERDVNEGFRPPAYGFYRKTRRHFVNLE